MYVFTFDDVAAATDDDVDDDDDDDDDDGCIICSLSRHLKPLAVFCLPFTHCEMDDLCTPITFAARFILA